MIFMFCEWVMFRYTKMRSDDWWFFFSCFHSILRPLLQYNVYSLISWCFMATIIEVIRLTTRWEQCGCTFGPRILYFVDLCGAFNFQLNCSQGNASGTAVDENVLPDFVSARIEDLCVGIPMATSLVAQWLLNAFLQASLGQVSKIDPQPCWLSWTPKSTNISQILILMIYTTFCSCNVSFQGFPRPWPPSSPAPPEDRITQLVDQKCPPSRVLVSCIHSVRDSLRLGPSHASWCYLWIIYG